MMLALHQADSDLPLTRPWRPALSAGIFLHLNLTCVVRVPPTSFGQHPSDFLATLPYLRPAWPGAQIAGTE
jgi:hypothetical protein